MSACARFAGDHDARFCKVVNVQDHSSAVSTRSTRQPFKVNSVKPPHQHLLH